MLATALVPGSVLACSNPANAWRLPMFLNAFMAMILAIGFITLLDWAAQKLIFKNRNSPWNRILWSSCVTTSVVLGAWTILIPSYRSMYASFGTELPVATQVLVSVNLILWLPALLLLFVLSKAGSRFRTIRIAALVLLGELALLLLALWAMYLPVFLLC
jgi:quinol-cytochrome oxidoreductase complex cytochrome b subunit